MPVQAIRVGRGDLRDVPVSSSGVHFFIKCYLLKPAHIGLVDFIHCSVAGLSGIYDLNDHYEYETELGIEDISTTVKAMYAPERLARFSPTYIISNLPRQTR